MYWPTPQDYNEAIQTPQISFKDPDLRESSPELSTLGLPRPNTGAFASVYRVNTFGRDWAVRCFLRNVEGQHQRYAELSKFIMTDDLIYTVGFEYLQEGIKVKDVWYPILKMEWVDGVSLDQFVLRNLHNADVLSTLIDRFLLMSDKLMNAGVAHGDLQHGNIMVLEDNLRLVDYDGMFVPGLAGQKSTELGHPNYQHPGRCGNHFGPYLDSFSARVILTSLKALSIDPSLWNQLGGGDECLLFRRTDFANPPGSLAFSMLEHHSSSEIRTSCMELRAALMQAPELIPHVCESVKLDVELPLIPEPSKLVSTVGFVHPRTFAEKSSGLPDWLVDSAYKSNLNTEARRSKPSGPWPRYEHYTQALLNPTCFDDPELRSGVPIFEERGYGSQGIVFHIRCFSRHVALKCFLNDQADRRMRYEEMRRLIKGRVRKYFVDFEYLSEGIQVKGYWYPALKMEWVFGMTLNDYIQKNQANRERLDALASRFRAMMKELQLAGIAHGDLEPSNILIVDDDFKLIDYDNIFVPSLQGFPSPGCGHPGFQHPARRLSHFGPALDNFSAHVIHTELRYLSINPRLWELIDNRLRERSAKPSLAFMWLDKIHLNGEVRQTARLLNSLLSMDMDEIPYLEDALLEASAGDGGIFDSLKNMFGPKKGGGYP